MSSCGDQVLAERSINLATVNASGESLVAGDWGEGEDLPKKSLMTGMLLMMV